ncbi:hypothetical protein [Halosolutus gelatinilyticus]|uniref:hypothetical protein n=1 Tax=Halosolutus gelatinilyticus TaxID=2931975 RepID=UPI001FF5FEB6|nr:hypothetical protein [Halosolutus gelatinilyticus]
MDDSESDPIGWRRDASTSLTVRALWALGVGTFLAAIVMVVFWRIYELAYQVSPFGAQLVVASFAAIVATALALAVSGRAERYAERATDAIVGAVVMGAIIGSLMLVGRIVSQRELLDAGAGPFTGLAALTIPLALVALVLASFLRSVGAFDRDEGMLYFYDPEQAIDLSVIDAVSSRRIGDAAVVTLEYAQPDGQYVAGPRRIVVPPRVASEIHAIVGSRRVRVSERVKKRLQNAKRRLRRALRS